ncbi:MAG: response regulator transcription factor [Candidatus Omnitrophica bacterium]|nr:response regulator transcription factor [Candidatus Omnitrophota bacterium]
MIKESCRILIIEDDAPIGGLIKYNLERSGYLCHLVEDGVKALELMNLGIPFKLILLDIMLPNMNGFEVCRLIKESDEFDHIPIIMLTARGEEKDRIAGFEIGADDYILKPFSPREMLLRVKAVLRRGVPKNNSDEEIYQVNGLRVDVPKLKVYVDKNEVKLTAMEFKLMLALIQPRGRVQTRDFLLNNVWEKGHGVTTRTVDTHISFLRNKLGRAGHLIETIRGFGYRIKSE